MFWKKKKPQTQQNPIEKFRTLDKLVTDFAKDINQISTVSMFEFMAEAIKKDEKAKSVEKAALMHACIIYNTSIALVRIGESSLNLIIKERCLSLLKEKLYFWNNITNDNSPYYLEKARAAKQKSNSIDNLFYGLFLGDLFFSIYNDSTKNNKNRVQKAFVKDICDKVGLEKIYTLSMNFVVNTALIGGASDIEKITDSFLHMLQYLVDNELITAACCNLNTH